MPKKHCKQRKSVYANLRNGRLVLNISFHVDDLKGGGEDAEVQALVKTLEDAVGKGKPDWLNLSIVV